MTSSMPPLSRESPPVVTLYREVDEVIFEGEPGWQHRIPLAHVATDEQLQHVLEQLRATAWMTDSLDEQFQTEVHWLRRQLPPGK